ncbi:MAG: hypothetical protein ISS19_17205 [Bacteroidales bacterium]|nr:hypothetical protein [Bacteroidales bacterium]
MPYRRLPNTDNARLKAMKKAQEKGKEIPPFKLAFSQSSLYKVTSFLPAFEKTMLHQKGSFTTQIDRNKDYHSQLKKAKLYISHFIQVVNMAIQRGELSSSIRDYYKLNGYGKKLPPLNNEEDVIRWGNTILEGETQRMRKGLSPITNPTVAVVKVRYEKFLESYRNQKKLQESTNRALQELKTIRPRADDIILDIWNEVEDSFKDLPDNLKREKAAEYGLVYIHRKNEQNNHSMFESSRQSIS